jgi:cytoskeletal protein CcmA (bactofilin family)
MDKKNSAGFILPFVLILITVLVAIIGGITYLTTVGVENAGNKLEQTKALNIAEAGLNKAIWFMVTHPDEGGEGAEWRTGAYSEDFGGGSYTFSITDHGVDPNAFYINSRGYYRGTEAELEILATVEYAHRFVDYALHSDLDIDFKPSGKIKGNVYADGNITVEAGTEVSGGTVVVTPGHGVTGEGTYTEGPNTTPLSPVIDYAYYENKFLQVESGGPDVISGDQVYTDLDLNSQPLLVNGSVTLEGSISGKGEIVATGRIHVVSGSMIGTEIKLIARQPVKVEVSSELKRNVMLYSDEQVTIGTGLVESNQITALTPRTLVFEDNVEVKGIFFGGQIVVGQNVDITGNLIGGDEGTFQEIGESVILTYKNYTKKVPPGFATTIRIIKWTKK